MRTTAYAFGTIFSPQKKKKKKEKGKGREVSKPFAQYVTNSFPANPRRLR